MNIKLTNHRYSQCHVEDRYGVIVFVSYRTPVVMIDADGVHALPYFDCSATTRKQVGWFLQEYAPYTNYRELKRAYYGK